MTAITLDEILRKIQELMDSGEGDLGRLRFILMTLRRGNPLYKSDQKYLEKKLNTTFVLVEKHQEEPKPAFELISSIRELIKLGIGDSGRLQFIIETLQKGKPLYKSDKKYLNEKSIISKLFWIKANQNLKFHCNLNLQNKKYS